MADGTYKPIQDIRVGDWVQSRNEATGRTGPGEAFTTFTYTYPGGPLIGETLFDESGNLVRRVARTLDAEGQVTQVVTTGPGGAFISSVGYAYDGCGRPSSVTDARGNVTSYAYNQAGELASVQYPGGDTVSYPSYDNDGNPLQRVDSHGTTTYTYSDPESLLTDVAYPAASNTASTHVAYDAYGRTTTVSNGAGWTLYNYDDDDLPMGKTVQYTGMFTAVSLAYFYNPDGSLAELSTPAGAFQYGYDAAGRLSSLSNPLGESTRWNYDHGDELTGQSLANNLTASYGYDVLGSAKSISYTQNYGQSSVAEFDTTLYDGASNLQAAHVSGVGLPQQGYLYFSHDGQDRLTSEQMSAGTGSSYSYAYGYDQAGNVTQMRSAAVPQANAADQIPQSGVTYDANGNPSAFHGQVLTWDAEDSLVSVGTVETNAYTADGLRASVTTSAGTTYFLYDGATPVCEVNASGQITALNTWGANGLAFRTTAQGGSLSPQNSTFYTFDQRGATAQRLDLGGNVLSAHAYDAYGQPVGNNGPAAGDPYSGFGGQEGVYSDAATGLYLMGHRFYDPSSGRFLNRDPAGVGNLYAFADGNPEDESDPLGLAPWRFSFTVGDFCFDNDTVGNGAWVGVNAVLSRASGGLYDGGVSRCDPSFKTSCGLADVGITAFSLALGGAGELGEGDELLEAADGLTCPCFVAGTMVEMADGSHKPIQDVQLGELVKSRDPITGEVKAEPVAQVFVHPASSLVTVTLSDGETLTCTPSHPFYVSGKGFVPAGELTAGAKLVSGSEATGGAGTAVSVSCIAWQKETAGAGTVVYNLGIASTHTYFVASASGNNDDGGVWVHNDCTDIAANIIKGRREAGLESGEVWNVTSKFSNRFHYPAGGPKYAYHDVVKVGDEIIDTFTYGHENPMPINQWMNDFDAAASPGAPGGQFEMFWNFAEGSGEPARFADAMAGL